MYYPLIMSMNKQTPLLLDLVPSSVGYSLRKLRNGATNSIRVRRSSDNTEQDIGFIDNDLDTISLLDFVGYNLFTYSENISNSVYSKSQLNIISPPPYLNVEIAPDGTLSADKVRENTANSTHFIGRNALSIINSTNYNVSFYLKQGERTKVQITSNIGGGTTKNCDFDLITGTISKNTFLNTPIVTIEPNGWFRFSVTILSGTTFASNPMRIFLLDELNNSTYTGDGTSGIYAWGFQLSQTSTVKKYQKTESFNGGNGFIARWYDQSINNNHSEQPQTTPNIQAQIVSNGNLILDADTGKITSTWTLDGYNLINSISANTQYFSISMFRRGLTATDQLVHLGNQIGNEPCPLNWAGSGASYSVRSYMTTLLSYENVSTIGRCIITSLRNSANLKVAYRNGVQLTNTATESPSVGNLTKFGQISNVFTSGQYQEYIYWDSDESANRVAIETNINNYWNAY